MFDFEEWSERVFQQTNYIDEPTQDQSRCLIRENEPTLSKLWDEMMNETEDESVIFLKTLLSKTRDLMDGKLNSSEFHEVVKQLRKDALDRVEDHS